MTHQPSWFRLVVCGLAAGLLINVCEWVVHAGWLDHAWRDAFAALGKTPTGCLRTAARTALVVWIAFWVIPTAALQPLALFPNRLLAWTVLVGFIDGGLAT